MVEESNEVDEQNGDPKPIQLIHWFRSKGLRFHDQPSLYEVLAEVKSHQQRQNGGKALARSTWRCVYLLDPWFASSSSSVNKWCFLLQALEDLDSSLRRMGSRLFVIRGQPAHIFPALFKEWHTTHLTFEADPEPYGKVRDAKITKLCAELSVVVNSSSSHTLYNLEDILNQCPIGTPYPLTFASFQAIIQNMDTPPLPCAPIDERFLQGVDLLTPLTDDHDSHFGVPSLNDLGFPAKSANSKWPGGETEALLRLERHLQHKAWVASFGKPKMTPNSLMGSTQTGLSPYLR